MKQKRKQDNDKTNKNGFPELASLMIVLFAVLYTSGWSFAYHYFGYFNVGLSALELPKEEFFIFSYWVIEDNAVILIPCGLFVFLLIWCLLYLIKKFSNNNIMYYLFLLSLPVILLLLFGMSYRLGTYTAEKRWIAQKNADYPAYPCIEIFQTPGASPKELNKSLQSGCYRQLIQNKDKVFVFKPIKSVPQANISTLVVHFSQIHSMRLLPVYNSCD